MSDGQVALVTGVTSGVGRGIARALARRGVQVVGTGRREGLGRALEDELAEVSGSFTYVAGDVRHPSDCARMVAAAVDSHGRLDLLVNNAATVGDPVFCDSHVVTEDWWDSILDTNLKGAFFCSTAALVPMLAQGQGSIVNIASAMGLNVGPPRMAAYTASKAGLIALTKTMAVEYARRGIRCNVIVLGAAEGEGATAVQEARRLEGRVPAVTPVPGSHNPGRITGEELAETVAYLAGPAAAHVNGAALAVDSALTAGIAFADR